jgi:hypothetical protein
MMGFLCSLNRRIMGSINKAERTNAGKKTRCLPAVPINANAQFASGKNISNAAIRHNHPTQSPTPAIIPALCSLDTSLSKAL